MPDIDYDKLINSFYGSCGDINSSVWIVGNEWQSPPGESVNFLTDIIPFDNGAGWNLPKGHDVMTPIVPERKNTGYFYNRTRWILGDDNNTQAPHLLLNLFPVPMAEHKGKYWPAIRDAFGWDKTKNFADYERERMVCFRNHLPDLLNSVPDEIKEIHAVCIWSNAVRNFLRFFGVKQDYDDDDAFIAIAGHPNQYIWRGETIIGGKTIFLYTADWGAPKCAALHIASLIKKAP